MKKFLQWFITLLQILFGLAFAALLVLYLFDKVDIGKFKDTEYLKYIVYACGGLYVVLSAVVMAVVLRARGRIHSLLISSDKDFTSRISVGKIKKLAKEAAAETDGVKLEKLFIKTRTAGYVLKLKISVSYRNVREASEEFKRVTCKLIEDVYGIAFANVDIIVNKVKTNENAAEARKEVKSIMEINAAKELAETPVNEYVLPQHDSVPEIEAAPYNQPLIEDSSGWNMPEPEPETAEEVKQEEQKPSEKQETAAVLNVPEEKPVKEPMIRTTTAVKTASSKPAAKPATASKTGAKKPAKQVIDPNDPPPFKL